jgi:hypothetical protein
MRLAAFALAVAAVVGSAPPPASGMPPADNGTVDFSWDACEPILATKPDPAAGPVTFYATVTGQRDSSVAHQVWWLVLDENFELPDAWRFDDAGCQATFYTYSTGVLALAKSCPPLVPLDMPQIKLATFRLSPPALGYPTTSGNGYLAVSYLEGSPNLDPNRRYLLAAFTHDFTWAVDGPGEPGQTCGGFDHAVCVQAIPNRLSFIRRDGMEFPWHIGNGVLSFRTTGGCPVTAAHASTWGSIKHQYH